jgi:hypothetical protein
VDKWTGERVDGWTGGQVEWWTGKVFFEALSVILIDYLPEHYR